MAPKSPNTLSTPNRLLVGVMAAVAPFAGLAACGGNETKTTGMSAEACAPYDSALAEAGINDLQAVYNEANEASNVSDDAAVKDVSSEQYEAFIAEKKAGEALKAAQEEFYKPFDKKRDDQQAEATKKREEASSIADNDDAKESTKKFADAAAEEAQEEATELSNAARMARTAVKECIDTKPVEPTTDGTTEGTTVGTATPGTEAPATTPEVVCAPGWEMPGIPVTEDHRWFTEGIQSIKEAKTEEDARNALNEWLRGSDDSHGVMHDAKLLANGYNVLMGMFKPEVAQLKAEELVDAEGCATEAASNALTELEANLAIATVTPEAAITDQDAVNTGRNASGDVTRNQNPGITGDTVSLRIDYARADGTTCTTWILGRCGQLYVSTKCGDTFNYIPPTDETDDKRPVPLEGTMPHPQPGAGGRQEGGSRTQPQEDNPRTGYSDPEDLPRDSDGDGFYDVSDACPTQAETFNQFQDTDGCPDTAPVTPENPTPVNPPAPAPGQQPPTNPGGPAPDPNQIP